MEKKEKHFFRDYSSSVSWLSWPNIVSSLRKGPTPALRAAKDSLPVIVHQAVKEMKPIKRAVIKTTLHIPRNEPEIISNY